MSMYHLEIKKKTRYLGTLDVGLKLVLDLRKIRVIGLGICRWDHQESSILLVPFRPPVGFVREKNVVEID